MSSTPCRECGAGVDAGMEHCHGTVIIHALHRAECTEDGCETTEIVHAYRIDCDAVGCPCGQQLHLKIAR
jgi:hypothetical protein